MQETLLKAIFNRKPEENRAYFARNPAKQTIFSSEVWKINNIFWQYAQIKRGQKCGIMGTN